MRHNINGLSVDLKTGVVLTSSERIVIRSKTLQVLVKLIDLRDRIVSKQELLDDIWHDVIVQEQVLAQSVKELRDIFGSDIIKTFPRNGYQWVAELASYSDSTSRPVYKKPFFQVGIVAAIILVFSALFTSMFTSQKLTIALLPVDNAMQDKEHNWVSVQGLEYLNQRLAQTSELDVIGSGHVLYALERLEIDKRHVFSGGNIYPLRAKLEADLLVKTRLTGFPLDYQLHYFIHTEHSVERGVINAETVNVAFDELIEIVAKRFGSYHPNNFQFHENVFSNEAFARGVELYLKNEFEQATPLFASALQGNHELLAARRYLAASYANTSRQDEAIALLKENIQLAGTQQNRELIRAYLMIGYLKINWPQADDRERELQQASEHIALAKQLAEQQQDKLFIAYSYEELGKIKRLQGQYVQAIRLLTLALSYHQEFNSTYGQTAALIELAKVAAEQLELDESTRYLNQALTIAERSNAQANLVWVYLAKADIARSQLNEDKAKLYALQAKKIAQHNDNQLLISRVEAWFNHTSVYSVN
ncbi:CadC family transcriptional regulator [Pseudoalteromonas citrea]|uniref:CadC family transcriptional regulator n=1 Tax=Pseudoalteromonas citrea TaxID=43655 RepID=A0A5S3XKQ7_9GAMM|nr:winged helix-turn-helix domain-containing protein [Pseudoalteromonas citrea]TMP40576.1 CadC family transcriptional regulator [Pseudoalteromonas citrea]TMP54665.1 CadC family transcriptional regulator [Pseudoalteromonas citrea]